MGLEQAHEALEQGLAESSKEGSPEAAQSPEQAAQEIVDLSSLAKFKADGKEWTWDEVKKSMMFEQDYRKKTQMLAQERKQFETNSKFDVNLKHDIVSVLKDPSLVDEFKRIYPKEFHHVIEALVENQRLNNPQQAQAQQSVNPVYDREISQLKQQMMEFNEASREAQINSINASLDSLFSGMKEKYPLADEEIVVSRAQALLEKSLSEGDKHLLADERGNPKPEVWDKIWKSVNDQVQKRFDGHYKEQVSKQKQANVKAKDSAPGGGIPGQAPKRETLKEASERAIRELSGR